MNKVGGHLVWNTLHFYFKQRRDQKLGPSLEYFTLPLFQAKKGPKAWSWGGSSRRLLVKNVQYVPLHSNWRSVKWVPVVHLHALLLVLAFQNYLPCSYTEQACDGSVTRETIPGFLILKKQLSCLGSDKRKPMPGPLQFPISLVTGDHSLRITLPRQEAVNGLEITNQTRRPSRLRKAHSMCVWVRPRWLYFPMPHLGTRFSLLLGGCSRKSPNLVTE